FLTREALTTICETTLRSVSAFERNEALENEIRAG
ncbi:MAG: 2-hydroxyacid dehydrogenase, partial [Caballeronia sp.]